MKKKKTRNSRGKAWAMWTHFYITSSLSYEHSEKINETALGINTKNVVSEMETICKLSGDLSCGKTTSLVSVWQGACVHMSVPNSRDRILAKL